MGRRRRGAGWESAGRWGAFREGGPAPLNLSLSLSRTYLLVAAALLGDVALAALGLEDFGALLGVALGFLSHDCPFRFPCLSRSRTLAPSILSRAFRPKYVTRPAFQ